MPIFMMENCWERFDMKRQEAVNDRSVMVVNSCQTGEAWLEDVGRLFETWQADGQHGLDVQNPRTLSSVACGEWRRQGDDAEAAEAE